MRFFRPRRRRFDWRTRLGFAFLIFANLAHWLVSRGTFAESNVTDLVQGLLFGIAIGAMLLGIRAQSRCASRDVSEI